MAEEDTTVTTQLVGELLQQVLRDATPQPPQKDRSRQQLARIARRLRERRRDGGPRRRSAGKEAT